MNGKKDNGGLPPSVCSLIHVVRVSLNLQLNIKVSNLQTLGYRYGKLCSFFYVVLIIQRHFAMLTKQAILPAESYPQSTYVSPEAVFTSHNSGGNDIA